MNYCLSINAKSLFREMCADSYHRKCQQKARFDCDSNYIITFTHMSN